MLSKEEIEKDIKILKNISECFTYSMWSEDTEALRRVLQYIEQLETQKQELIKMLEEAIDFAKIGSCPTNLVKAECLENVLKILKGDKQ